MKKFNNDILYPPSTFYSLLSLKRTLVRPKIHPSPTMHSIYSLPFFILLSALTTALSATHLVYEAPNNTWFEILAVRACVSILLTTTTSPNLWLIKPFTSKPKSTLLHRFTSRHYTVGITETTPNTFSCHHCKGSSRHQTTFTPSHPTKQRRPIIH